MPSPLTWFRPFAALALAALLTHAATAAAADAAVSCHCFRDRSYDPVRPASADPYILATTRSSTLSAAFGADKASLVRAVMSGTQPDDLWVAHWAAARTRRDAGTLLASRQKAGSWKAALAGGDRGALGSAFTDALARGASDAELAALAVDDVAVSRLRAAPDLVHVVRAAGASSPELLLALLLAPRLGLAPTDILAAAKGGRSWGALLAEAGIAPPDIDDAVRAAIATAQSWLVR